MNDMPAGGSSMTSMGVPGLLVLSEMLGRWEKAALKLGEVGVEVEELECCDDVASISDRYNSVGREQRAR